MANIFNTADNTLLSGMSGNDTIKNGGLLWYEENEYYSSSAYQYGGDNVTIDGGAGNDTIENWVGSKVTIDAGAGNDSIYNNGDTVKVYGDAGDDYIRLTKRAENNLIQYAEGDGNDKIVGFNSDDTLQITSGDYTAKVSGKDVIVTVGTGKITLKNAKGKTISIMDSDGKVTSKKYTSSSSALFAEDNLSEIVGEKSVGEFEFAIARDTISATVAYAEK